MTPSGSRRREGASGGRGATIGATGALVPSDPRRAPPETMAYRYRVVGDGEFKRAPRGSESRKEGAPHDDEEEEDRKDLHHEAAVGAH